MESNQSLQRKASQSTLSVQTEPKHEPVSTATPLLKSSDATLAPQGWPTSPSHIKYPLSSILLNVAFDIALFAFSTCFLVFSMEVMSYDGVPTSESPTAARNLTRATKYSPTVFPLLFASVVGRATQAILLWRLEKGERIQILDTLATSTSLTSTVTSQIHLRQISVVSVLLVAVWTLSPIGGQASLRQMSIETVMKRNDWSFQYVVPKTTLSYFENGGFPSVNRLFTSTMFAGSSTKASPVDLWGNVRIPRIEHYETTAEPDSNGWFTTRLGDDDLAAYASFAGIPLDGVQDKTTADYDFRLQTEYLQLTCASSNESYDRGLPSDAVNITATNNLIWWSGNDTADRMETANDALKPLNFSYVEYPGSFSCLVKTTYVEVGILCAVNSTCQAVKVRRSKLPQPPPAFTFLDMGSNLRLFMGTFMLDVGGEAGQSNLLSNLQYYLRNPSLLTTPDATTTSRTLISDEAWSGRLGQLLNSYWNCAYSMYTATGGINKNTSYFWDTNMTFDPFKEDSASRKSKIWSSQGNKHEHIDVIKAHRPWAITLAIASFVLIAFSLIPPIVRHFFTASPDIAMNFSSLATRNNPHVPISAGGSFLPAADRFRLLKDLRLRFADAEGKSDVGNLVIAAQGMGNLQYSKVRKERLYE